MKPRLAAIAIAAVSVLGVACQKSADTKGGTVKAASSTTTTTAAPSTTTMGKATTTSTGKPTTTTTTAKPATTTTTRMVTTTTTAATVSYANCDAVKAAGTAPLYAGQPGYSSKLDRDRDGVACEN